MKKKKLKPLTKKEHYDLFCKVDSEGFDYYLMYYGPDLDLIERLGFDRDRLLEVVDFLRVLKREINVAESFSEDFEDEDF